MTLEESSLSEDRVSPDPTEQFQLWYAEAIAANAPTPNAMALATATPDGRPSARMVLLKDIDERGLVFYSNQESRKGRELLRNPRAALVFHWPALQRQIRVEGLVVEVSAREADAYFQSRPRGSRIGARASPQSQVIPNRAWLDERVRAIDETYGPNEIPRPEHWGGYRLVPDSFEFWQGRIDRLHDRILYTRTGPNGWAIERLAP